ncbi:MAG TPA: hypothetical protein VIK58_07920, partial [Caldimonas sp.]
MVVTHFTLEHVAESRRAAATMKCNATRTLRLAETSGGTLAKSRRSQPAEPTGETLPGRAA